MLKIAGGRKWAELVSVRSYTAPVAPVASEQRLRALTKSVIFSRNSKGLDQTIRSFIG